MKLRTALLTMVLAATLLVSCTTMADEQSLWIIQQNLNCTNCTYYNGSMIINNSFYYNSTINQTINQSFFYNQTFNQSFFYNSTTNNSFYYNTTINNTILINYTNGSLIYERNLDFIASTGTAQQWTNMALAFQEFLDSAVYDRMNVSLTDSYKGQFQIAQSVAGTINSMMWVQCSRDAGGTWYNLSATNDGISGTSATFKQTPLFNINSNCYGDVLLRVVGQFGDGVVDPAFRQMRVRVQYNLTVATAPITLNQTINNTGTNVIISTETYLGQDAADGNDGETYDYTDEDNSTGGSFSARKVFLYDFQHGFMNESYGRFSTDWTCIYYGHGIPNTSSFAKLAVGFPFKYLTRNVTSTTILPITVGNTLKADVSIKFRFLSSIPYGTCDDDVTMVGSGAAGNVTLQVGNTSRVFNLNGNITSSWLSLTFPNITLGTTDALMAQINNYGFISAVLRQNISYDTCFPLGIKYNSCWDIESMTIEQYYD